MMPSHPVRSRGARRPQAGRPCHPRHASAFTMVEVLVVTAIIVLLLAVAVPAFSAMLYSAEESLARTKVTAAVRAARDGALRASGGRDYAVVFLFEPRGRLTLMTCVQVGELVDEDENGNQFVREVFAPVDTAPVAQLPKNWVICGYAPAGTLSDDWYDGSARYDEDEPNWVFPESGFYDREVGDDGQDRQTFMLRFKAGSGELLTSSPGAGVLIVDPAPATEWRTGPYAMFDVSKADDLSRYVQRVLASPTPGESPTQDRMNKRTVFGNFASDTILAKPVSEIALLDVAKLADGLGLRVDRGTGTVYAIDAGDPGPAFISGLDERDLFMWISGDTNLNGTHESRDDGDRPQSVIFTVDRYTGNLLELSTQP